MNDFGDRLRRHLDELTPEGAAPFHEVLSRRDERRRRRRGMVAAGAAMAVVVAVSVGLNVLDGSDPTDRDRAVGSSPGLSERPDPSYTWGDEPSPVVLRLAEGDVELRASGYCWDSPPDDEGISQGTCADGPGTATRDLPSAGEADAVDFWFGLEGWDFRATFTELGVDCPRSHATEAESTGDQTFRVEPAGPPGRYRVDLFGEGDQGSVSTSFAWSTPVAGQVDPPLAKMALISQEDDGFHARAFELSVQDLAFQPEQADVEVTMTTDNGSPMVVDAEPMHPGKCHGEGSLSFSGEPPVHPDATLGPAPFTYEVRLTLDGEEYVGTAVWPQDQIRGRKPNVELTFTPPLPALN